MNDRYSLLNETVLRTIHERQRALARWARTQTTTPLSNCKLIEIGCGSGSNLLDLLRLGAVPENLFGNELLEDRCSLARKMLPSGVQVLPGDASTLEIKPDSFDVVYQSTVFSSLLDDAFQDKLADCMWRWIRPGGGVLWYDFTYNNPINPDVRGVPLERVRSLFPNGRMKTWRITLAPPISRRIPPSMYSFFNIPFLRTHVLCWITKD
jgi:SAM-dependent methyltransferase